MIYLTDFEKISENNFIVNMIHRLPFDETYGLNKTKEELEKTGILIEILPIDNNDKPKVTHVNPNTKEIWYEYIDIPKSNEELTKDTIENLQKDNAQLLKENVKKGVIIESLSKDISDIYKLIGGTK